MTGGLALFLINKKWTRVVLVCLTPVCIILAYLGGGSTLAISAVLIGMLAVAGAPLIEGAVNWLDSRIDVFEDDGTGTLEDDILDNKKKWRLIVAGYVIFILFAIISIASIIRLNAKINTLYGFTQDLEQRIEEVGDKK